MIKKSIRPAYKSPIFFKALCVFVSLNSEDILFVLTVNGSALAQLQCLDSCD